jgi:hypothetical protein
VEEESERIRADVLGAQPDGLSGSDASSDEDEQRLDEGGDGDVAADLASLVSAFDQRGERRGEAGLGRAPLAQEDDEVFADGDETLIRGLLLPAAMKLLGEWNWYLPRWLEWLPRLNTEGSAREDVGESAAAPGV